MGIERQSHAIVPRLTVITDDAEKICRGRYGNFDKAEQVWRSFDIGYAGLWKLRVRLVSGETINM
jgi:hypothetical protein